MKATQVYAATVEGEKFVFSKYEWETILTDKAFKLFNKTIRQGGRITFGLGSIKDYFKPLFKN